MALGDPQQQQRNQTDEHQGAHHGPLAGGEGTDPDYVPAEYEEVQERPSKVYGPLAAGVPNQEEGP